MNIALPALLMLLLTTPSISSAETIVDLFDPKKVFAVPDTSGWRTFKNECLSFTTNPTIEAANCSQERFGRYVGEKNKDLLEEAMNSYRVADVRERKKQEKEFVEKCYSLRAKVGYIGVEAGCQATLRGLLDVALPRDADGEIILSQRQK